MSEDISAHLARVAEAAERDTKNRPRYRNRHATITNGDVATALREVIERRVVGMTNLVEIHGQRYEVGDLLDLAARMLVEAGPRP